MYNLSHATHQTHSSGKTRGLALARQNVAFLARAMAVTVGSLESVVLPSTTLTVFLIKNIDDQDKSKSRSQNKRCY